MIKLFIEYCNENNIIRIKWKLNGEMILCMRSIHFSWKVWALPALFLRVFSNNYFDQFPLKIIRILFLGVAVLTSSMPNLLFWSLINIWFTIHLIPLNSNENLEAIILTMWRSWLRLRLVRVPLVAKSWHMILL